MYFPENLRFIFINVPASDTRLWQCPYVSRNLHTGVCVIIMPNNTKRGRLVQTLSVPVSILSILLPASICAVVMV